MTWTYHNQIITEIPDCYVGFVYLITNTYTNRRYIGKKLAKFSKVKYKMHTQKNGKKVRKKIRYKVDSDWKTYYGSSEQLSKDVATLGAHRFKREILHFCESKAACSYLEAKEQFYNGVLESNDWYNGQIAIRVHKAHINGKI
jgi:hypothetical protein